MKNNTFVRPLAGAVVFGSLVTGLMIVLQNTLLGITTNEQTSGLVSLLIGPAPSVFYGYLLGLYFYFLTKKYISTLRGVLVRLGIIILSGISLVSAMSISDEIQSPIENFFDIMGVEIGNTLFVTIGFVGGVIILISLLPLIYFISKIVQQNIIKQVSYVLVKLLLISTGAVFFAFVFFPEYNPSGNWFTGDLNQESRILFIHTVWQIGTMFVFMRIFEQYVYYKKQELETTNQSKLM